MLEADKDGRDDGGALGAVNFWRQMQNIDSQDVTNGLLIISCGWLMISWWWSQMIVADSWLMMVNILEDDLMAAKWLTMINTG